MSNTSAQNICPKCGASIPAEAPQGLCPKCLLQEISIPTEAGQSNSKSSPPSREELIAAFPHLEILELIGQGGMGFVFKARQPKLDRLVALKILPQSLAADPAFAERFSREGRLLARLNHPNIVTVHDFGRADLPVSSNIEAAQQRRPTIEFFYLLMEYVDGVNLRQAMRAGRFTPDQALAVVPKICEALQFAHNEGILHRDIKPENILLDTKGRVKIADFGIAKLIGVGQTFLSAGSGDFPVSGKGEAEQKDTTTGLGSPANRQAGKPALQPEITAAGKTLGTPNYMAPEQIERPGEVDHRADIYSLGVVFYEMLTGELPLGRFAPPSQKSAADPRLDDVVLRALEKEPNRRTQSAGEVKTQVETITSLDPQTKISAIDRVMERIGRILFAPLNPAEIRIRVLVGAFLLLAALSFAIHRHLIGNEITSPKNALLRSDYIGQRYFPGGDWIEIISVERSKQDLTVKGRYKLVSEESADLTLNLSSTNQTTAHPLPEQSMRILKGEGEFELSRSNLVSGLPHVSMYANEKSFAGIYFGTREEARESSKLVLGTHASMGTWSPTISSAEKFDPRTVLEAAEKLMKEGSYEDALQRHLWFHNNVQKFGDAYQNTVRLTSALSTWDELGRRYLKAKQALVEIRDDKTREIMEGRGYSEIFQEVQAINREFQNDDATLTLFKTIRRTDPKLAQQCYFYAENLLISNGEYQLCLEVMGDAQQQFSSISRSIELQRDQETRMAEMYKRIEESDRQRGTTNRYPRPAVPDTMKKHSEDYFVSRTCRLIEILIGAERKAEAEKIRDQALTVLDDARLKSAISDAEERVQKVKASLKRLPSAAAIKLPRMSNSPSINTNFIKPSASIEKWSPPLAATEKPDLGKILTEGKELMAKGEFEESLQRHIWYHNHALEYDAAQSGVRLSFALADWIELGRRHPKAKQALIEIRDRGVRELVENRGSFELFQEVAALNRDLGTEAATITLFKLICERNPKLAKQCYGLVEDLLVEKREYAFCLTFIGDWQQKFESNRLAWEKSKDMTQRLGSIGGLPKIYDTHFVEQSCRLIEILIGTGHKPDAEAISNRAVAVLNDPRLKSAFADAEKRVQNKL